MRNKLANLGNGAHALAMQILGNADDAQDAVQDAFERVLRQPESYQPAKGTLKSWFLTIVRNGCIDQLRGRRTTEHQVERLHDTAPQPEQTVLNTERDLGVRAALAELPNEQRQILVLRDYLDLSYNELASVMDIPKGTVMSRLHRARLALKKGLENYDC